jgi:CheY-like chemotaxis protein
VSRRILIAEPDAAGRAMMDRVLAAEGYAPESVASVHDVNPLLFAGAFELAIVDERAGHGATLEEIRFLRRQYPMLPVIAIGAWLSLPVMQELLRLQVLDALAKPFTPPELREAVARAQALAAARHTEALEYAAAIAAAREAIARGRVAQAAPALARAQAVAPLDAETMALWALLAELDGRDGDADRGYRAALSLRHEEGGAPPDPHEGLARLGAYDAARPVTTLRAGRAGAPFWVITDPVHELRASPITGAAEVVVVTALGLTTEGAGAVFLRDGDGPRAFAVMAGSLRPESVTAVLSSLGAGPLIAGEATRSHLDLARVEALRGAPRTLT